MNNAVTYTNHLGAIVEIGPARDVHVLESTLHDYLWSYDEDTAEGFFLEPQEKPLQLGMWCEDENSGIAARNGLYEVLDADVVANKPGRINVGSYYMECFAIQSEKANWHFADHIMEVELTLYCPNPEWVTEELHRFFIDTTTAVGSLGYPHGYPHGYGAMRPSRTFTTAAVQPSDYRLFIYGPVANPTITIGANTYRVNVDVPDNGYMQVDSREKTIVLTLPTGEQYNVLNLRDKGAEGSGSYIFAPIEPGSSVVSFNNAFGFDLIVYITKREPPWMS